MDDAPMSQPSRRLVARAAVRLSFRRPSLATVVAPLAARPSLVRRPHCARPDWSAARGAGRFGAVLSLVTPRAADAERVGSEAVGTIYLEVPQSATAIHPWHSLAAW
jgi:hypothetical protein